MKKILCWFNKHAEEVLLVYGTMAMIAVIFLQVISRYVLNASLPWSEEMARYIFVWQIWLAVPYTVTKGRHLRLEAGRDMAGPKGKFCMDMLFFAVSALFFLYIGAQSVQVVRGVAKMRQLTPAMQIPKWICYLSVPTGSFLAAARFIQYGILRAKRFFADFSDTECFAAEKAKD